MRCVETIAPLWLLLCLGTHASAQGSKAPPPCGGANPTAKPAGGAQAFSSSGIALLAQVDLAALGSSAGNSCWGYTAPSGREYAIIGTYDGTVFVEITDPSNPVIVSSQAGPQSTWRDMKTYADHAYSVSEGGQGIQVFDLAAIDAGGVDHLGDVTAGGATNTHTLGVDPDSGYLYRFGTDSGLLIYDVASDPSSPAFVAAWSDSFPNTYIHEGQPVTYASGPAAGKQVLYACAGDDQDGLWVLDVTDKSSIGVMDKTTWSQLGYSHQGWLDSSGQYFYINDELDESTFGLDTRTIVVDVSDPSNVFLAGTFDNGNPAIGHNGYVRGDFLYEANYTSGLRIFDLSVDPLDPPEVAWFDTWPADDSAEFESLWNVYPFFPSGIVIGSDISGGLYVWWIGEPLVEIDLLPAPPDRLDPTGEVLALSITEANPGDLVAGTERLHYDTGSGFQSLPLVSQGGGSYEAHFPTLPCPSSIAYYFSAESTNGITWTEPQGGASAAYQALVALSETVAFADDFETDTGWSATNLGASSGDWDREVPVNDPGWSYDPFADYDGSGRCWLTDNAFGNTDVDGGAVQLLSPAIDLSQPNPIVEYAYYLYLTDATGIDALLVEANDNAGSGWREVARHESNGSTAWRTHRIEGADFEQAGVSLTANLQMRFTANDDDPQSIVEAGLDAFEVKSLDCGALVNYCAPGSTASGCLVVLSGSGTPSLSLASGFTVTGADGEGSKDGLFFYGQNGRQANPWGNGTSFQCVTPPVKRTPVMPGGGTNGTCSATWSIDFNAFAAANPQKAPSAGTPTQLQLWFRDPASTSNQTTSLSDAAEFTMAP